MDVSSLTILEEQILREFCRQHPELMREPSAYDHIQVGERSYSGAGFLSELLAGPSLETNKPVERFVWTGPAATLNGKTEVGCLVFVEQNRVSAIEGFTFGESWPEKITRVEFHIE
uniref:hypothetical protein n=1 Tax=Phaeobacter sp. PT47_59 TaxID=3029979 RepID=UPI002380A26E|nr:hypothetical protein [Phaeobacter sp. PT47_59]